MDIQTRIGTNNRMADKHIARQANKQKYYQRNKNGERQTKKANINMESRQTKIWTDKTHKQADKNMDRETQTDMQTKIWRDMQTDDQRNKTRQI